MKGSEGERVGLLGGAPDRLIWKPEGEKTTLASFTHLRKTPEPDVCRESTESTEIKEIKEIKEITEIGLEHKRLRRGGGPTTTRQVED